MPYSTLQQMPQMRPKDPITRLAENLVEASGFLVEKLKRMRTSSYAHVVSQPQVVTTTYNLPELEYLTGIELGLLTTECKSFIAGLRERILYHRNTITFEELWTHVFTKIPSFYVSGIVESMDLYLVRRNEIFADDENLENILKRFMDYSAEMGSPTISAICQAPKALTLLFKIVEKFTDSDTTKNWELFPIKPAVLVILWAVLLLELLHKTENIYCGSEKSHIAKMAISIVLSLFTGATGFIHSGGLTGSASITSWIRTLYNARKMIERDYPYIIPEKLKFYECENFDTLTRSLQISAAKGLNMVYTFRVGNTFLENMEGSNYFSEDKMKNVLRTLWPLPTEDKSLKMYKIYNNQKIYNL